MSGRLKAFIYGPPHVMLAPSVVALSLALAIVTSAFAISMSAEVRACRSLAPAVQHILSQHERVQRDLLALEVDLRKILEAPRSTGPGELVALIEASAAIRAGLE